MHKKTDKIMGGMFGAIVGDAVGVPYEFHKPENIPPYDQIDMVPPSGFDRTWSQVPIGTYSDDGAQLLCVADNLTKGLYSAEAMHHTLRRWARAGYLSVDNDTFDIGMLTSAALSVDYHDVARKFN